ncbi:LysR family transcriptional regulator [Serratia fonticola]|uniref:LysR family transcriptional regulator n=1 Tax=Serratia fonticola TaxID=47917 RepID=UPI0015C68D61|nr:LysR family transcriptional regulator [Serratia fonticola]NYA41819.1 LysR family transcriptional regulator [Serratia fonticola]
MDKLGDYATYISVFEAGSFSVAARRLNVGQPAVSKAIVRLEQQLNTRLLLRSTHGLRPTEAGQQLYLRAKHILHEVAETESAVSGVAEVLTGRLRVASSAVFSRMIELPDLSRFLHENPELAMDLLLDEGELGLIAEGIDIALRIGDLADSGFTARKLGSATQRVIGAPAYFARAGMPQKPRELLQHDMVIHHRAGGAEEWLFTHEQQQQQVRLQGRVRVSATECLREMVVAGFGATVACEGLFRSELREGKVVAVLPQWQLPPLALWAVFPSGHFISAKARAFADFIQQLLQRE